MKAALALAKLDSAALLDRHLLERVGLALEASQLCGALAVAADEERRGPEHDDGDTGDDAVFRCLAVLDAGDLSSAPRHAGCFLRDLAAAQVFIDDGRDVCGGNFLGIARTRACGGR